MNKSIDKNNMMRASVFRRGVVTLALGVAALLPINTFGHNVGQVQTTKYFTPETITLLQSNAANGIVGFQVGDTVSYIISFQPVADNATQGANGYVTDYIPVGTQVVDAAFVMPSGSTYVNTSPNLPAAMPAGSGAATPNTFLAPFTGFPSAKLSDMYADTGIFYSTDSRTALDPTTQAGTGMVAQGAPGYYVNPTRGAALATIINPAITTMTTHNLWDADQTNAFGTTTLPTATPKSARAISITVGSGPTPVNVGTPISGPDSGFQLDDRGGIGPWNRVSYPGSTIGCAAPCTAGAAGGALTVSGTPTSLGWPLSAANPLPANTNAVRWAVGALNAGVTNYVKISLKLTQPVPVNGLINNGEVAGGDASGTTARDSAWVYWVPSVANNNSSLFVFKQITNVCTSAALAVPNASACPASTGLTLPANAVVRYQITYLNTSNSVQTNVKLVDTLPIATSGDTVATTLAAAVKNFTTLSGPTITASPVLAVKTGTGATTVPASVTFNSIPTLGAGLGGVVAMDVALAATSGVVQNTATLTTTAIPGGVSSNMVSNVIGAVAQFLISKTANVASVLTGGIVSYTVNVTNTGTASGVLATVVDTLPTASSVFSSATAFTYVASSVTATNGTSGVTGITATTATSGGSQAVTFTLPAATYIQPNTTLSLTFSALVGSNVTATNTPYTNSVTASSVSALNTAPVTVGSSALSVVKSIACVFVGTTCNTYTGGALPVNAKLRYQINYANTGSVAQSNVVICDQFTSTQATAINATPTTNVIPNTASPNGPGSAVLAKPAAAVCGMPTVTAASGVTLSFPAIPSLAAGASGVVYVDMATSATSPSYLTNTAKVVSTQVPNGATNTINNQVYGYAQLQVSKTAVASTIVIGAPASYVISVTNTGTIAASGISIMDLLPFVSGVANAATRFNYVATQSITAPMSSVVATSSVPPTLAGYTTNTNQQQVTWNFGTQNLAPGASFTISFSALPGSSVPAGTTSYLNNVAASYVSGTTTMSSTAVNTAPVQIATGLAVNKTINCVYDATGTVCNPYTGSGLIPVNAKVRYQLAYQNTGATAETNVYLCDQITSNQTTAGFAASMVSSASAVTAPAIGTPTTPANALCAFPALVVPVSGVAYSYPVISSLAAGATGVAYIDVAMSGVAANATISNTAKIVSAQAPAGQQSTVNVAAINVPNLSLTKTTSTPSVSLGGTATYTITLKNNGSASTSSLKIYDFLPFSGTVADATKRFNYATTTAYTMNGAAFTPTVTPASSVPPTISPYSSNANQQQVVWDFGTAAANQLAPGATLTLTFNATIGAAMTTGFYTNSIYADYGNPSGPNSQTAVTGTAQVAVTNSPAITLTKTVLAYSDPINGVYSATVSPLFIPGGVSQYTVTASNAGGPTDSNSVVIADTVPLNETMYVKDLGVAGSGPIIFNQGTPSSGLTYTPSTDVSFYGITPPATVPAWGYVPVPGANGCDPAVQQFRINPKGIFVGSATLPSPSFNYIFRMCLQ